jgi:hypothetical protein
MMSTEHEGKSERKEIKIRELTWKKPHLGASEGSPMLFGALPNLAPGQPTLQAM